MKRVFELYGRLRDAGFGDHLGIELAQSATAAEAFSALRKIFALQSPLIDGAALATETEVLSPQDRLPPTGRLAVLPPVCGG